MGMDPKCEKVAGDVAALEFDSRIADRIFGSEPETADRMGLLGSGTEFNLKEVLGILDAEIQRRKRIEAQLVEYENKFRSIIDASPMGIHMYRLTTNGQLIFSSTNPAADQILNCDNQQFVGQTIEAAFPALADTDLPSRFRRICDEGGAWHSEQVHYEDGRIKGWFEVHAFQTQPGSIAIMFSDISDRKLAEETLKKEKEKFRTLSEMSPLGIALLGDDGCYKYVNPKFKELFGYPMSEIPTGRQWFRRAFPDKQYRKEVIESWRSDLEETAIGEVRPRTYKVRCHDGTEKIMHFRPVAMAGGDILVVFEDITERRQLEDHLQQAQKMEAIGTLAGGIAHDFNNILAAIMGYGELLAFEMQKDSPAWHHLQAMLKSSHRAKDLVGQILAFSRHNELNLIPVKVSTIIKEALKMLRASLPATIEIRQKYSHLDGIAKANPTQIHQVLMNLCTNAGHAMRETGGVLEVGLDRIRKDPSRQLPHPDLKPGTFLRIRVSDTGHGMTPDQLERIFDPYYTTKDTGEGTGLGLAVVRGIVKAHSGVVIVDSNPNHGSRFDVYLPEVNMDIPVQTEISGNLRTGKETILFVDDEQALVTMSKQMLELLGYQTVVRTSSIEAYELFQHDPHRFDLVMTDMTMPNMTGAQLAGKLLNIRPDIPVILCTGYSEQITEKRAKDIGIRAFVLKPLVMREIAEKIREVLDATSLNN